jgi:hypothetical protein
MGIVQASWKNRRVPATPFSIIVRHSLGFNPSFEALLVGVGFFPGSFLRWFICFWFTFLFLEEGEGRIQYSDFKVYPYRDINHFDRANSSIHK